MPPPEGLPDIAARVFALLDAMECNQKQKVIDLARRLKPGLTAEDIRNPHDFPELDDPDWHFEDGQLTGIQSAQFALRALFHELLHPPAASVQLPEEHHEKTTP